MKIIKVSEGWFIQVNRKETIALIRSLSGQMNENNPNSERLESYSKDGEYFSISVEPKASKNKLEDYRESIPDILDCNSYCS